MPKSLFLLLHFVGLSLAIGELDSRMAFGEDWRQWRGPSRSGSALESPPLRDQLPAGGLSPMWVSEENFTGGGGWSSPIIADGKLFLYTHRQQLKDGVIPPVAQYPTLSDEKKAAMSPSEFDAYEELRLHEQITRLREFYFCTDQFYCLDRQTGKTLWTHSRPSGPTRWRQSSTPLFDSGKLYYMGADRTMVCLSADDGRALWSAPLPFQHETDEPLVSSPVAIDKKIVVNAVRLLAFDAEDGQIIWQGDSVATRNIYSSPTIWTSQGKDYLIAHAAKSKTICVDPKSGEVVWSIESFSDRSSPTVVDDLLFTFGGSRKGGLRCYRLSKAGAEQLWVNQRLSDQGSSPTVSNGYVFVQSERELVCVDIRNGETAWAHPIDANDTRYTSPACAAGKVFFAAEGLVCMRTNGENLPPVFEACILADGRLLAKAEVRDRLKIDELERSTDGQKQALQIWQKEVIGPGPLRCASPALTDGLLFLRTGSRILCYDLSAKP